MEIRQLSKIHIILGIDFDGTIVKHRFPYIGELKLNAKKVINELYDEGFGIFIWTCRDSTFNPNLRTQYPDAEPTIFHVHNFLEEEEIKYDGININHPQLGFHPVPKIYADIYIDDKQLGGIPGDWKAIKGLIYEHVNSGNHYADRSSNDAPGKIEELESRNNF